MFLLNNRFEFYLDDASQQLTVQADRIHLFDTVRVNTCEETCQVEDIVATVTLDSHGLDSGCNSDQCCTSSMTESISSYLSFVIFSF